jgi:tight adherence protein B
MGNTWIIVALVFVAVFLAVEAFYYGVYRTGKQRQKVNRRLSLARHGTTRQSVLEQLRRERGLFGADLDNLGFFQKVVVQSGLRVTKMSLISFFFLISFGSFLLFGLLIGYNLLTLLLGGVTACLVLFGYIWMVRARRKARFGEQLPEALDVMVRSLRAGHPIPVSLALVAEEMPDPAGSEFGMAADEITYGSDLESAMDNLYQRVGQDDLMLVVIAVSIQAATGGNLSEILSKLARVIRERFKMRRKIRAISSEGRFSGWALSLLPIIVFGLLNLIAPTYYGDIWDSPILVPVFIVAVVMMLIGNFIIYRMVNFRF